MSFESNAEAAFAAWTGRFVRADVTGMHFPVRCTHCQGVYDAGKVEVTARYTDCSMWKAPCCDRVVDDRGDTGWKSFKDYVRLDSQGREVSR